MALAATAMLQASAKNLVIELTNGTKIYYPVSNSVTPFLKVTEGTVSIDADQYAFADADRFYLTDEADPTAVVSPEAKPVMREGFVYLETTGPVRLYTPDGQQLPVKATVQHPSATAQLTEVDLNGLKPGTYLLKTGNKTLKFTKK